MKHTGILLIGIFLNFFALYGQSVESLTLSLCYDWARSNYPLVQQQNLIQIASDFSVQNIATGHLPRVNLVAQATYQSDVVELPINAPNIPVLDKDQYQVYAEVNQTLYNGNRIQKETKLQTLRSAIEQSQNEVDLYSLYSRVSQLYFGILLAQEQERQLLLQEKDIQLAMEKVQTGIQNGTAIESDYHTLHAHRLSLQQQMEELHALKKAYLQMLGVFISKELTETTLLQKPVPERANETTIERVELDLINQRMSLIDLQDKLRTNKISPKLSVFARAGYGKPGLNILSNEFNPFFLGGAKLEWPLFNAYTQKREKEIHQIEKDRLENQKETFLFNTRLEVTQQNTEIEKFKNLLATDDEIIASYRKVKESSQFKLDNGLIDVNDYLRDVNQESKAIQNKSLHEVQLMIVMEKLRITQGIK